MKVRWRVVLPIAAVCSAAVWWVGSTAGTPPPGPMPPVASTASAPAPFIPASQVSRGAPFRPQSLAERQAQLALWRQRLQRSKEVLAAYQASTRYPFDSRPAKEHADQWSLHPVIGTDVPLAMPGATPIPGMRVHTTQQKVFVTGADTVQLTLTAVDDNGNPLPLKILSSASHGAPPSPGAAPATPVPVAPTVMQPFADDGTHGDTLAGDGVYSTLLDPVAEGFGNYSGTIRTEVIVQSGNTQGYVAFDVVYSPQVPATWTGTVHEAMDDGSLDFLLGVDVAQPGRYVVTGRVDDADGKPFAFVSFNDELGAGARQVKLTVYGRLVRDQKPAFPLVLHDVDGFLLKPDTYPDRALMPSLEGKVHASRAYKPGAFSDAAFASDETARYLAEYGKDVNEAQQQVDQLQGAGGS